MAVLSMENAIRWIGGSTGGYAMETAREAMNKRMQSSTTVGLTAAVGLLASAFVEDRTTGNVSLFVDGVGGGLAGWLGSYVRRHQNGEIPSGTAAQAQYYMPNYAPAYQPAQTAVQVGAGMGDTNWTDTEGSY